MVGLSSILAARAQVDLPLAQRVRLASGPLGVDTDSELRYTVNDSTRRGKQGGVGDES
jgi:hypothetical protein